MSNTNSHEDVKRTCLFQLDRAASLLLTTLSDFTEDELRFSEGPLSSAADTVNSAIKVIDAVMDVASTGERGKTSSCGAESNVVAVLQRRLMMLNCAILDASPERFVDAPSVPMPPELAIVPGSVAEGVVGTAIYLAIVSGELQAIRSRLGKPEIDFDKQFGF